MNQLAAHRFFSNPEVDEGLLERLSTTRTGALEEALPLDFTAGLPATLRKLPAISGLFGTERGQVSLGGCHFVGWDQLMLTPELPALIFRMQCGAHALCWLANPCDPAVWTLMDRWEAVRTMLVMPVLDSEVAVVGTPDFAIAPLASLRASVQWHEQSRRPFLTAASKLLQSGLERIVASDLPAYPDLESVQGCILVTENTGLPDVKLSPLRLSDIDRMREDPQLGKQLLGHLDAMARREVLARGAKAPEPDDEYTRTARELLQESIRLHGQKYLRAARSS